MNKGSFSHGSSHGKSSPLEGGSHLNAPHPALRATAGASHGSCPSFGPPQEMRGEVKGAAFSETIVAEAFPQVSALAKASGRPLHIGLPLEISARLRAGALARGMAAPAFAAVLLAGLTERPDLLDAVLEAAPSRTGQGRDLSGATALSRAVIYLAASHAGPDGWARLAPKAVLSLAGIGSHSGIIAAMRRCHRRGLMELAITGTRISAMRLTPTGAALAARLTGVRETGGKA